MKKIPHDKMSRSERLSLVYFLLTLFTVIGFVAWGTSEIKDLRQMVSKQTSYEKPRDGLNGLNGNDGTVTTITRTEPSEPPKEPREPKDPINGKDGTNATDEQVAAAVEKYMAANPVKNGTDGKDGVNGVTILVRYNPLTLAQECKIVGDLAWQPLENCE